MATWFAAGGLLLFSFVLITLSQSTIPSSDILEGTHEIHNFDDDDAEDDPSQLLAYIHVPSEKEMVIHQLSRNLLTITKDLISFTPRTKSAVPYERPEQKLALLRSLKPRDVASVLSQNSIAVPPARDLTCDYGTQFYRTMDGSCNNLQNPCWGKTDEPYQRWLPPAYANGVDEPRRMKSGYPLPNPRQVYQWVSSQFEPNPNTTYDAFSNLLVVWGQLVAHDILLTPTVTVKVWDGKSFKNEKPHCCKTRTPHSECIPIVMNYQDGFYPQGECLDIARSTAFTYSPYSCSQLSLGNAREQMNQLTSYLDASVVYGTSEKDSRGLREDGGRSAKLIMDWTKRRSFLSRKKESSCKSSSGFCDKNCFLAGEKRCNENPILASMHILWAREHNRLVDLLRFKGWEEETLFHVVRKIVGAMLQHTTYSEYIPLIVGPTLSNIMNLTVPSNHYKYDPSVNPSIYNVFATAAFRFGHSMVSSRHLRAGKTLQDSPLLSQDFFSMDEFCNSESDSVANLILGQLQQKVQKVDCLFSKQVTNHLFSKQPNGKGMDLFSLNIQRGRDHGIPPYNEWRKVCGLPVARDYADLKGIMPDYVVERLENIYGSGNIGEIDLFVGGVSEFPVNDGILGPTFTCLVATQFRNLKFGDRFWYENLDHPGAFTWAQVSSIQRTTLSSLICRNSDVQELPRFAFLLESVYNTKMNCQHLVQQTDLDLRLW